MNLHKFYGSSDRITWTTTFRRQHYR